MMFIALILVIFAISGAYLLSNLPEKNQLVGAAALLVCSGSMSALTTNLHSMATTPPIPHDKSLSATVVTNYGEESQGPLKYLEFSSDHICFVALNKQKNCYTEDVWTKITVVESYTFERTKNGDDNATE